MSIELQLTTGDEEWTFNMTESIVPSYVRDFRVAGRRITLLQGEPVGSVDGVHGGACVPVWARGSRGVRGRLCPSAPGRGRSSDDEALRTFVNLGAHERARALSSSLDESSQHGLGNPRASDV